MHDGMETHNNEHLVQCAWVFAVLSDWSIIERDVQIRV